MTWEGVLVWLIRKQIWNLLKWQTLSLRYFGDDSTTPRKCELKTVQFWQEGTRGDFSDVFMSSANGLSTSALS